MEGEPEMEVHDSSLFHLALRRIRAMIIEEQQSISSADEQRVRDIGLVIGLVEPGSETLVSHFLQKLILVWTEVTISMSEQFNRISTV